MRSTEHNMLNILLSGMTSTFNSTVFFLSKLGQEETKKRPGMRQIELDIVEDPHTRQVCQGASCNLYYNDHSTGYLTTGNCQRSSLCTETRILKDSLFLEQGNISNTTSCVNFDVQLKTWKEF